MKKVSMSFSLLALFTTGVFSSCNAKQPAEEKQTIESTPQTPTQTPMATENPNWNKEDGLYAEFNTTKGKIVVKLEMEKVPVTVANFVSLAEGKNTETDRKGVPFYDGLTFHRVIANFMVQGGDPQGSGQGGPGYKFGDEFDPSLKHDVGGILSMANAGPGTNGSQFFITHVPTPWLDGKHSVFGSVVEGMAVVNAIAQGDKIETLKIVRVGKAATAFDAPSIFAKRDAVLAEKASASKKLEAAAWDEKVKAKYPTAVKTASGLYYTTDVKGTGATAQKGQTVVAHYTGTFWDGKKFDSSLDRGQPFEFALGNGQVIKGWDEGFGLYKIGSKGKLIIPYYLAYGEQGYPGAIPPKSDLIFEVEMLGVK